MQLFDQKNNLNQAQDQDISLCQLQYWLIMPKKQPTNVYLWKQDLNYEKYSAGTVKSLKSRINKLAVFKLLRFFCKILAGQKKRLSLIWLVIVL